MGALTPKVKRHLVARACFQEAFEALGGVPALVRWARSHPSDFYRLYAQKLIPTRIEPVSDEGEGGALPAIQVVFVTPGASRTHLSNAILERPRIVAEQPPSREEIVP